MRNRMYLSKCEREERRLDVIELQANCDALERPARARRVAI